MSFAEIEAELDKLAPDELRRLALKSWSAFVHKEGRMDGVNECDESNPEVLRALDEAIVLADPTPGKGCSGNQLRRRLDEWISK